MLLGLSTGQKVGLLVAAGVFIVFALAASFLFPRRSPDFPGERLGSFVALTLVLFLGMLSAVFVLANEEEAEGHETGAIATETLEEEEEGPGGETGTVGTAEGEPTGEAGGDAAAGKQVFASAGCVGCHTLADAGASGTVGPNLDEAKPDFELVVDRVTNGKGGMPAFGDQLSDEQIQNVAAYVSDAAGS